MSALMLMVIWLFHLLANFIWLCLDTVPLIYDAHKFHLASLKAQEALASHPLKALLEVPLSTCRHPFLVGLITGPFHFIFGKGQDAGIMIHSSIFLAILLLSIYGIGKHLHNKQTGLLTAFIVSIYPAIFNHLRIFVLDLALTSFVAFNLLCLLKSKDFTRAKWSCFWALSLAAGLLIKSNFIAFIITPFIFVLWNIWKKRSSAITGLVYALFGIFLSFIYYIPNSDTLLKYREHTLIRIDSVHFLGIFESIWAYLKLIIFNQTLPFFFVLFVASLLYLTFRKIKYTGFLFVSFLAPLILLSIVRPAGIYLEKEWIHVRYFLPGLTFMALISAYAINQIPDAIIRRTIIVTLIPLGIIQYLLISFMGPYQIPIPSCHLSHPVKQDWNTPVDEILQFVTDYSTDLERNPRITMLHDIGEVWGPMQYKIFTENLPIELYCDSLDIYRWHRVSFSRLFDNADFVLMVKNPDFKESSAVHEKRALRYFNERKKNFILSKAITLPSEEKLLIFVSYRSPVFRNIQNK